MELHLEHLPHSVELAQAGSTVVCRYIDERKLPYELLIEETSSWRSVVAAIKNLSIRGAPAIGIAGVCALALWAQDDAKNLADATFLEALDIIENARPTAVNLSWAIKRACSQTSGLSGISRADALVSIVYTMQKDDEACNRAIGKHGAELLGEDSFVLTHCNAGSLATYYFGTALGVVYAAAQQGKIAGVYADETRPVGQGARLTTWELSRVGIPVTLICDNMAASLMTKEKIDAVIVGADRIAANGDVANKIGTYGLAILAQEHDIPFYVAAPTSTIDLSLEEGTAIPIELRDESEVLSPSLPGVDVWNPAFDITPARYISALITEMGVISDLSHLRERCSKA